MIHPLTTHVANSHRQVEDLLASIHAAVDPRALRERHVRCDRFMSAASRHVFAAHIVYVSEARRLLDTETSQALVRIGQTFEHDLVLLKNRLYGASGFAGMSLSEVFQRVEGHLGDFVRTELTLARELAERMDVDEAEAMIVRWQRSLERAPSRPHPHLLHQGRSGRMFGTLARRADALWDSVQGRGA